MKSVKLQQTQKNDKSQNLQGKNSQNSEQFNDDNLQDIKSLEKVVQINKIQLKDDKFLQNHHSPKNNQNRSNSKSKQLNQLFDLKQQNSISHSQHKNQIEMHQLIENQQVVEVSKQLNKIDNKLNTSNSDSQQISQQMQFELQQENLKNQIQPNINQQNFDIYQPEQQRKHKPVFEERRHSKSVKYTFNKENDNSKSAEQQQLQTPSLEDAKDSKETKLPPIISNKIQLNEKPMLQNKNKVLQYLYSYKFNQNSNPDNCQQIYPAIISGKQNELYQKYYPYKISKQINKKLLFKNSQIPKDGLVLSKQNEEGCMNVNNQSISSPNINKKEKILKTIENCCGIHQQQQQPQTMLSNEELKQQLESFFNEKQVPKLNQNSDSKCEIQIQQQQIQQYYEQFKQSIKLEDETQVNVNLLQKFQKANFSEIPQLPFQQQSLVIPNPSSQSNQKFYINQANLQYFLNLKNTLENQVQSQAQSTQNTQRGNQIQKIVSDQQMALRKGIQIKKKNRMFNFQDIYRSDKKDTNDTAKVDQYIDFLKKINFSNNIQVVPSHPYKVFVGKGNNSIIIKNCVKQRWWLQLTDSKDYDNVHFVWTQIKTHEYLKLLKPHSEQYSTIVPPQVTNAGSNNTAISLPQTLHPELSEKKNQPQQSLENQQQMQAQQLSQEQQQQIQLQQGTQEQSELIVNDDQGPNDSDNEQWLNKLSKLSKNHGQHNQGINNSFSVQRKISYYGSQSSSATQTKNRSYTPGQNKGLQSAKINKELLSQEEQQDAVMSNLLKIMNKNDLISLKKFRSTQINNNDFDQVSRQIKQQQLNTLNYSNRKLHNHLENYWNLSNKKALYYNLKAYFQAMQKDVFQCVPVTFHIQKGMDDPEYKKFLEYYSVRQQQVKEVDQLRKDEDNKPLYKKIKNIWIIKPGEITNRGHGINVCGDLPSIQSIIKQTDITYGGKQRTFIVQQYIDHPFLYNKRKFDIRCYMMITSINGIIKGYWYQEGYIRTSSKEFTVKNLSNKAIHLTNDAVQNKLEDYGKFESGNKISFNEFQRYLDINYPEKQYNFMEQAYPQMKNLATECIRAVHLNIDPERRESQFEVFGLDFMIDDNFKVWLIEVNTNPCLAPSSSLLARLIPNMIENAFRIAVDPILIPPLSAEWPQNKKHTCPENILENNKFELVFDELLDGPYYKSIMKNQNQLTRDQIFQVNEEEEEEEEKDENAID